MHVHPIHTSVESTEEGRRSCQSVQTLELNVDWGHRRRREKWVHTQPQSRAKTMPTQPPDLGVSGR